MKLSTQEWLLVAALLTAALLIGWLTGAPGFALFLAALIWIGLQQRELRALERWSRAPLTRPDLWLDTWADAADRLYRAHRAARRRTRRTFEMFGSLRVITDALPDAAVILDSAGIIENFNSAAARMLHLQRTDRGGNLAALLRQPDFAALARGRPAEGIVEFASPFEEERRLEARRIPINDDHALMLVRDVTQLNRLLTMRQDFVANVSHELRTPLTVVVGYLETMTAEDIDAPTLRELLRKLESPTLRMRALVDDLLLLSRLEANPPPTDTDLLQVDLNTIIRSCVAEARVLSKGCHRFVVDADRALRLLGVETELYSAVLNLVTNAVRYSPDGGVVRISWQRTDAGACLKVTDQGLGIAPEHLERITERFYRVDLAHARVRGGTGLGLAIVKHVLKRHRSHLQVHSELGRGSTFYCEFPDALLRTAERPSRSRGGELKDSASKSNARVPSAAAHNNASGSSADSTEEHS
jgi:two-component system phosphate regulon sensor histidine kinase PhoR